MVEKPDEHEGRVRADYNIEIKVTDSVTKKVFLCHSSNISLNGVLVVSEEKLPPQHICHINIALLEDQRHENEINLSIDGRVAREIPQGFAKGWYNHP